MAGFGVQGLPPEMVDFARDYMKIIWMNEVKARTRAQHAPCRGLAA